MKCDITFPPLRIRLSPSVWREWIEIPLKQGGSTLCKSPSVWREWIEIGLNPHSKPFKMSPSVWREWIEMENSCSLEWSW